MTILKYTHKEWLWSNSYFGLLCVSLTFVLINSGSCYLTTRVELFLCFWRENKREKKKEEFASFIEAFGEQQVEFEIIYMISMQMTRLLLRLFFLSHKPQATLANIHTAHVFLSVRSFLIAAAVGLQAYTQTASAHALILSLCEPTAHTNLRLFFIRSNQSAKDNEVKKSRGSWKNSLFLSLCLSFSVHSCAVFIKN